MSLGCWSSLLQLWKPMLRVSMPLGGSQWWAARDDQWRWNVADCGWSSTGYRRCDNIYYYQKKQDNKLEAMLPDCCGMTGTERIVSGRTQGSSLGSLYNDISRATDQASVLIFSRLDKIPNPSGTETMFFQWGYWLSFSGYLIGLVYPWGKKRRPFRGVLWNSDTKIRLTIDIWGLSSVPLLPLQNGP